jgi:putative redox protein
MAREAPQGGSMSKLRAVRTTKAATGAISVQLAIGPHVLIADTSADNGGDDLGPDPHELLDAALASCTALTLTLYARRKGMNLIDIEVEVDHVENDGVYRMRRELRLVGELSADERLKLLEIANRCPLHRTLSGRFEITSRLVD